MPVGFSFLEGERGQAPRSLKELGLKDVGRLKEEFNMPISALLARIRKLIPRRNDAHYDEIVRNIGGGALRPPPSPMSDRELSKAIAEFLKDRPSAENVSSLGRKLDPSSRT